MKPRLLDLFCGQGGASVGYARAGWEVVGVDLSPMPRYPFDFHRADALHYLAEHHQAFDAFHASVPCQRFSVMSACRPGLSSKYPDLIAAVRGLLDLVGKPYVLENVVGSPLRPDIMLCGQMFGLKLYRHRIFESNAPLGQRTHPRHMTPGGRAGHWKPGEIISVSGNCSPIELAREAMGIDWMDRHGLVESIPPAYAAFIGEQLIGQLAAAA